VAVYTFDPLQDPRWPEFLERHPHASVFHSRGWLEALRRTYGYEPIGYTTAPPRTALANGLAFCRVESWLTGRRLVSVPFSDHCEPLTDSAEEVQYLLDSLRRDASKDKQKYIEIRPLRSSVAALAGFGESAVFYRHWLDLRPSLEVLFGRFHGSCVQRKIRRAEREGVAYREGRSDALLRQFYELLLVACRRKRLPPQPLAWFRHVIDCMGNNVTIHVASDAGRPIASILSLSFKRTLVYKYGCSDKGFNRLGGTQLLLWKSIQEAKRRGLDEFDLGRSDFDTPGLVAFKDRWGTTKSVINYWRWSASAPRRPRTPQTLRLAKGLFARMPDRLLIAAGRMYRHMG
jgi:hypothetical protein